MALGVDSGVCSGTWGCAELVGIGALVGEGSSGAAAGVDTWGVSSPAEVVATGGDSSALAIGGAGRVVMTAGKRRFCRKIMLAKKSAKMRR